MSTCRVSLGHHGCSVFPLPDALPSHKICQVKAPAIALMCNDLMDGHVLLSAPPADDKDPMYVAEAGYTKCAKCASKGLVTIASASLMGR